VGSLTLTPRHAYPLYHGLAGLFASIYPGEQARAVNLVSAVFGALAVAVATMLASRLTNSTLGGVAAGMFLAFSYTFWSQAITAEVYTLHLLILGATLVALLAWSDHPTGGRLAVFYAIYALGFGNHLSMVLLLPALVFYLLACRPGGPSDPLRPSMIALAAAIACLGALQYAWNFRGLWTEIDPPASLADAFAQFWFDVTKADWRETLVMTVSETGMQTRPAMYWFDLRQQFGVPGVLLSAAGFLYVSVRWPVRGVLLLLLYAANLAFAWTYNVGDAYIFFMPSHYVVALLAGAGVAAFAAGLSRLQRPGIAAAAGALILVYPAWRAYDTYPAVDRSSDTRAIQLLETFTALRGDVIFGVDSNWQVQNAFEYFMHERRPGVPWFATEELEWLKWPHGREFFDRFIETNTTAGRDVVVTSRVYDSLHTGSMSAWKAASPRTTSFDELIASIPPGTPYVLAVLRPDREFPLNRSGLRDAWQRLTGTATLPHLLQYVVVAGRAGDSPVLVQANDRPFRTRATIDRFDIDIRMESWLPTDTIRRAGFGHVIVNRRHALTIERGVSFTAIAPGAQPAYDSGLFAPLAPFLVSTSP